MSDAKETYNFETEARQILDMMIYSVYSNKDIFLRELISNSSDALDKLHLQALTDQSLSDFAKDPFIRIVRDQQDRNLSVSDNGIGMTKQEVIDYIGTIAKSGTKEFLERLKEKKDKDPAEMLIGQFGVGFYSAFMVADKVILLTRKAGEEKAWRWESKGDGTYTLEEAERPTPGTTVTLKLKDPDSENGLKDYTSPWVIKDIVRTYSDFVAYPIKMQVEKDKSEEGGTVLEDEVLNSMKALWMRSEKEVTDDEYRQFYRHAAKDWRDPLERIVFSTEGTSEMHGLLFIPSQAPYDLFMRDGGYGVALYVKRVLIMEDCKDVLPSYLRFVRGVVDSDDLSLNISREILQQDRQVRAMKRALTRKVLQALKKMMESHKEKYLTFWKEFGTVLKEGLVQDDGNLKDIMKICLFSSTKSGDGFTTLDEYTARMPEGQDKIHYISGSSVDILRTSPHLESLTAKGEEVLLLADPVDEVWAKGGEYEGKTFQSAAVASQSDSEDSEDKGSDPEKAGALLDFMKDALSGVLKDVRISKRLTASPGCIVGEKDDMTPQMERIMKAMGKEVPEIKRVLEVNLDHPVLKKMSQMMEEDKKEELEPFCRVLYCQALLAEGGALKDPSAFSKDLSLVMERALLI